MLYKLCSKSIRIEFWGRKLLAFHPHRRHAHQLSSSLQLQSYTSGHDCPSGKLDSRDNSCSFERIITFVGVVGDQQVD